MGAGCGLVGISVAKAFDSLATLTDYEPKVVSNLEHNINANGVWGLAEAQRLDWQDT